jgi:prepilin peptidase CpaA
LDPLALIWASFVFLVILAAYWDLVSFTIPNSIVIAVAALFVARLFTLGLDPWIIGKSLASAAILFIVGVLLFSRGLLGGGDVKLIAAIGLWTGLAHLPRFLLVMAMAGGLLALVALLIVLVASLLKNRRPIGLRSLAVTRIPYGVAICVAGLDLAIRLNRVHWAG